MPLSQSQKRRKRKFILLRLFYGGFNLLQRRHLRVQPERFDRSPTSG
jgi:hypothetical protein